MCDDMKLEPRGENVVQRGMRYELTAAAVTIAVGLGYMHAPPLRAVTSDALPATRTTDVLDSPPVPQHSLSAGTSKDNAPNDRVGAQARARRTFADFAKNIQNLDAGGYNIPHPSLYFLPSHYSGMPGLCEATAITMDGRPNDGISSRRYFLVVGAFSSPPPVFDKAKPGYGAYKNYEDRITANCAARIASADWFTYETSADIGSQNHAQLVDGVVAAARGSEAMPFKLACDENLGAPHFCDHARKALADLDPKNIDKISGREMIYNGINHLEIVARMKGDGISFNRIVIHETSAYPGIVIWRITDVVISEHMQPIMN